MTLDEIRAAVHEEILKLGELRRDFDGESITGETVLFGEDGADLFLDSLDGLDLILALQLRFDVELDDATVEWSELSTIDRISDVVFQTLSQGTHQD